MNKLSNNLRKLRREGKLSQAQVATRLNISQQAYAKYESEKGYRTEPDIDSLKKLADFYGVSIDYLLGNETALVSTGAEITPAAARDIWFATLTPIQQSLVHAILQLDNVQQLRAQAYFSGLLGY